MNGKNKNNCSRCTKVQKQRNYFINNFFVLLLNFSAFTYVKCIKSS